MSKPTDGDGEGRCALGPFQRVKAYYEQYYQELRAKGLPGHRQTEKGIWVSSVSSEVFDLFCTIRLGQFNHFADLGSGDGKVSAIASLFTSSTGIECDEELVNRSNEIKEKLGLQNLQFEKADFLRMQLSPYDILFIYPDNPLVRLEQKLLREFDGYLIVCGGNFLPDKLVEKKVVTINSAAFRIYRKGWLRRLHL